MSNLNLSKSFKRKLKGGMQSVKIDMKKGAIGGFSSFLIILIGGYLVGEANRAETYHLFEMILPNAQAIC